MLKLSKRLQAAADFVAFGNSVADIGTDHGYLPIYLVQAGRCPKAVAMDIRRGPLEHAREHIAASGLERCIELRLSDGLEKLKKEEAESVVITGMGGMTVIKILEDAAGMLPFVKEFILEPQSDIAKVRKFLREHGMSVDREELVLEDGKYYPVLHVVMQSETDCLDMEGQLRMMMPPDCVQEALDQYGKQLVIDRHPVLRMLLERDKCLKQEILQAVQNSREQEKNAVRRQELVRQLAEIECLQKYMDRSIEQ